MTGLKKKTCRVLIFMGALALWACGGSGGDPSPGEGNAARKEMLVHWADEIIIPAYNAFGEKFDGMVTASEAFTADPSVETLAAFRLAWEESYIQWQTVELFEFGPAGEQTLRNFFNIYPADTTGIVAAINDPTTSLEVPAAYTKQGFPALDYLINGIGASGETLPDDAAIISKYTSDPQAAARKAYLTRIITRMKTLLTTVTSGWSSYRDTFVSKTGTDNLSSLSLVVNAFSLQYERYVRTGKIGIPSGATISSGGVVYPNKVEAFYKRDLSLQLVLKAHETAHKFFNGATGLVSSGPSFASYMTDMEVKDPDTGTELTTIMNEQFDAIDAKLQLLGPTLYDAVQVDNADVVAIHDMMQQLVAYIKVDMANKGLGVVITYVDNDGD
jgi:hypothetical protein